MARFWGNDTQVTTTSLAIADRDRRIEKRSRLYSLKLLGSLTGWCLVSSPLAAQITPDGTLSTQVNTTDNVAEITGGTEAGSNLFHSFQDFSMPTDNTAFFNNASDINNIIGRVTGNNISNLDGLIRANGTANLILINPSGINFGGNASLDIGGSFLGSTAASVIFEDGTVFNADITKPFLTISAPIGLQMGQNSQAIQVSGGNNAEAIGVNSGNTFALVGNGITFNGGVVTAESGRIDLGSVAQGQVSLSNLAAGWQLGYAGVTQFAELQLLAGSSLLNPNSVTNPDGGIQVRGSQITLERSQISAPTLANTLGADIIIGASESLSLQGTTDGVASGSQISSEVSPGANGAGGAVNIETDTLNIGDRSFISTMTFGSGDGGNINILARDVNITGTGFSEFQQDFQNAAFIGTLLPSDRTTGIFTGTVAAGTSGNLTIDASSLNLNDGAVIFSPVFTTGTGGDLNIAAPEININASAIQIGTRGNLESAAAGDINLETQRFKIQDGGTILNITFGDAAAGDINLTATESIELSNTPPEALLVTGIYANSSFGSGTGGNINIDTNQLKMNNGLIVNNSGSVLSDGTIIAAGGKGGSINIQAESIEAAGVPSNPAFTSGIGTSTYSASDAGDLTISTGRLTIRDGADFASATVGAGRGGQLTIDATDSVELIGITTVAGTNRGGLLATSGRREFPSAEATGASGNIRITTPELSVRDGASIDVQSLSSGDAGNLDITADSILLDNKGNLSASTIFGVGGGITIDTNTLRLDRGLINASVFGSGTGGNIEIVARDSVEVIGSSSEFLQALFFNPSFLTPESLANLEVDLIKEGILAATIGDGAAGTIDIQTANLQISEGGLIATATIGDGAAGSIFLNASESLRLDASIVTASTVFAGQGGDITINSDRLEVLAGGQITSSTVGSGNSGNLTINAAESVTVSGASSNDVLRSNVAVGVQPITTATGGNGGDLTITTPELKLDDRGEISIGSRGTGNAGSLQVDAESIFLDGQSSIFAATQSGGGGNVFLNADNIIWRGGSFTTATAGGTGNGGNISIDANILVALEASQLTADAFIGMGGNIQINAQNLFICGECKVSASSQLGVDGVVEIETLEPNTLDSFDIPQKLTQPQESVAVACPSQRRANISQLTITGRGGLPRRPQELLNAESLIEFDNSAALAERSPSVSQTTLPAPARSWYKDAQGTVILTAQAAGVAPNNSASNPVDCRNLVP